MRTLGVDASVIVDWLARFPAEPLDALLLHARPVLAEIWSLRANLTAYDAAYVALARALDVPPGHA